MYFFFFFFSFLYCFSSTTQASARAQVNTLKLRRSRRKKKGQKFSSDLLASERVFGQKRKRKRREKPGWGLDYRVLENGKRRRKLLGKRSKKVATDKEGTKCKWASVYYYYYYYCCGVLWPGHVSTGRRGCRCFWDSTKQEKGRDTLREKKREREKTGEQETNLDVRRWKEERKEGRKALALGDSQSVCFSCF